MVLSRRLALVLGGVAAAGGALFVGLRGSALRRQTPVRRPRRPVKRREPVYVRVTENGRKYHRDTCQLLRGGSKVIPIREAIESYEPCKACHPPGE